MALTVYCDAVAQGFTHPEAESMASEVLYQGLHFSKYDTLVSVLENEFERELLATGEIIGKCLNLDKQPGMCAKEPMSADGIVRLSQDRSR